MHHWAWCGAVAPSLSTVPRMARETRRKTAITTACSEWVKIPVRRRRRPRRRDPKTVKQEHEKISANHIQTIFGPLLRIRICALDRRSSRHSFSFSRNSFTFRRPNFTIPLLHRQTGSLSSPILCLRLVLVQYKKYSCCGCCEVQSHTLFHPIHKMPQFAQVCTLKKWWPQNGNFEIYVVPVDVD